MNNFRFILAGFAVYRLARFLSFDEGPFIIFEKLRIWSGNKRTKRQDDIWATIDGWINCPYCQGPYWAVFVSFLTLRPSKSGDIILTWLGLAGIQDFLETTWRKKLNH